MSGPEYRLEVVPYDAEWPTAFAAEALRIRTALGPLALRIDHHGSTSVPGLAAKPIIDIQVSVASLEPLEAYGGRLQTIGYVHVPDPDDSFCPFFHRPAEWPHSHHVHVVESGGREEARTLAFRDYLRDHPVAAREYEQLKRSLTSHQRVTTQESREAYALAKTDFIERIVAIALSSGYPGDACQSTQRPALRLLPLERLDIQPMASGNRSLLLTDHVDWDSFPAYVDALLPCVEGTVLDRVDGADQRVWTVKIGGQLFWLAYEEYPHEVTLDSKDSAASALIPDIRQTLLRHRAQVASAE